MSDEEFDILDDENSHVAASQHVEDDDPDDRHNSGNRRNFSMAMTQKLFGNLDGAGAENHVSYAENAYVTPRNRFEEILKEENVRIVNDQDEGMMDMEMGSYEKCVVFGNNLNSEDLCRNLEKRMENDRGETFAEFLLACGSDQDMLALFLSPAKSLFGLQDTIFRAFLQIKATQTKAFDFLLQKLNILAKRQDERDLLLAQTCVAHMRHLSRLFEPQAVFNTIFEFQWRFWSPNVRNDLIAALPEIFTDISLQQSTAVRLHKECSETQGVPGLPSFQLQIIETLRLLRMDPGTARKIRMDLCNLCMDLDPACLPSLVAFSLGSLLVFQGKADDEEAHFHEMLRQLARLLKIDGLKKKTSKPSSDSLIVEVFGHFLKFFRLNDKRAWKHITTWISKSKKPVVATKPEEDMDSEETPSPPEEESATWLTTFEAFLYFSLLSNTESCPPTFVAAVNSKILNIPAAFTTKFLRIIDLVISCKKFATCHLPALIHVARHCFWSSDGNVRQMGVSMWKQLFVGMEKRDREKVFTELMKHFSQSETECEAVLDVFFKVIKSTNSSVIQEFSTQIQKCIELIHKLSIPNIKRLFQVMLMMPSKSTEKEATRFEIDEIISRFLLSVSDREKFLGLLALLMKIQVEMGKKHSENQEHLVREGISRCEEAVKSSSALRGAFYEHMRIVLQQHKRTEEIRFLSDWSTDLLKRFKNDFFELPPNPESNTDPDSQSTWNLKLNSARLLEIAPMFELIKEIQVLKMRWREEDQDSLTSSYDISVIKNLSFAFEAVLPKDENLPLNRQEKLAQLFFNVQWTRTVLNGFLSQSSVDFLSSDDVSTLSIKNFYVMMDAEKKLAASLVDLATWNVPNLNFGRSGKRDVIVISSEKTKSKKGRKRKSDETTVIGGDGQTNSADVTVNDDDREENLEAEVVKEAPSVLLQLKSHYIPLKLRPIVHLMKLANKKRSALKYLCDELQSVIDTLIKQKKKTPPMLLAARRAAAPTTPNSSKFYHGDSVTIWFCVKKAVEQVWGIVELVFGVFAEQSDASQELKSRVQKDMDDLGEKSLNLIHSILSGELYGGEEKLSPAERVERKSVLIRIIEKKMLSSEHLSNDSEKARVEIGKFLAKSAEFSPTPAVAVAILDVFEDLKLDEDDDAETRKIMAKYALAYLKKDWSKVDELWSKGTRYTCAVRDILHHYIRLRKEKDQLLAIQWILTNKVVQLVPEDDKRKSCVFSQQSDDDLLEKEDRKATFYCISKTTFGVIFKTLFGNLNSRCLKYDMSASAAKNGGVDIEDTLESWETASSCFLILCLLLRINKIRTTAVLTSAIKEGKQFLITVSKKSSFIFLMDNITKGTNFDTICRRVEKILSAVQQGNRVLQSIGTFAKTNKCVLLLKKFPELRAESENCLRVIHSAMVKNECLNAFTVGLVKSRSIDGDIIMDQRASEIDSDSE